MNSSTLSEKYAKALQLLSGHEHKQAEQLFKELVQHKPQASEVYEGLAYCYLGMKQFDQAIAAFSKVTELQPSSASAWANLAGMYFENNQVELAEKNFKQVLEIDEQHSQAWHFLAVIQFTKKRYVELVSYQANALQYDAFAGAVNQASDALSSGNTNEAVRICEAILAKHNRHPRALFILALLAVKNGALEQAIKYLEIGLGYCPYDDQLRNLLSQLHAQTRFYSKALSESEVLVAQKPLEANYWLLHADHLVNVGQYHKALEAYQQAIGILGEDHQISLQQAHVYKALGDTAKAIHYYQICLANPSTKGSAFWALANISKVTFSDDEVSELENMALDPDLSPEQACQAAFALAKHYEDNEQYDRAFSTYQSANLNKPGASFNPDKYQQKCLSLIDTFSEQSLSVCAPKKEGAATPIFIIGLPRSGSTLVEQILASHSLVEGTMELKILPAIARKVFLLSVQKNQNASGSLERFTPEELSQFGDMYLAESEIYRTDKPYFIDKLPPNFQHVGLIKKILPEAIIIDVRRQPLSCGFGIFKQYFGHGHDFSYDLSHIAFYYQQYLLLMEHWHAVLPEEIFYCQYEKLIENPEEQITELLAFCNLEFETGCLRFYSNDRAVRTASSDQVRQPLNRKGMDMWKNYEVQLEPLKQAFREDILEIHAEFI
ncbi:tetratricopeptide repeat-containing sulfotransferase family protein [Flocculibacter collagenilyticus]|uniref:tetratricopeptide repeat-containing sulfotransferase family protein n=1 Tax=Flocculibacter collagenilyticus TaxID=2744479 RepID=UPI0018F4F25E|nr:tetratricopeptide repeat-containing sulfotransferase family protein [Flocculibacter collagenilyticus]